jgi:CheY-like chemotaxis protein
VDTAKLAVKPAEILLIDDDENYFYLTRRAFQQAKLVANLHHVNDGRKGLAFLRRQPPYADAPVPDIILLDIEMPVMDGREVLTEIIEDEALKHMAVVVFTTRDERAEILRMYQLRCNSYICKPAEFDKFVDVVQKLAEYWFSVAMLPSRPARSDRIRS